MVKEFHDYFTVISPVVVCWESYVVVFIAFMLVEYEEDLSAPRSVAEPVPR